jgi:hypothetical protein
MMIDPTIEQTTKVSQWTSSRRPAANNTMKSRFPIPSSIQDLERAPYDLLPYPEDFADDNEAARADSFTELVNKLEQGNHVLKNSDHRLFSEDEDVWLDEERMQALYTLVR